MDSHNDPVIRLREPLYWPIAPPVRPAVLAGMANRAKVELGQVENGVDIVAAHGEAAAGYPEYKRLIHGASLFLRLTGHPLGMRAADLGSGTGVAACILSKFRMIQKVFAVEYSEIFVTRVMPVVFQRFGARVDKIQRVVGDFNALRFEDNTLDIIAEINAFHHSEALELTLKECWRVLRPGGVVIAIDRAWPDDNTQDQLEDMLNQQLPAYLKLKYAIAEGADFTRRDWGEHERKLSQWIDAFQQQGFAVTALVQGFPRVRGIGRVLKGLPAFLASVLLASLAYRFGQRKLWIYGFTPQKVLFVCIKRADGWSKVQ